MKKTKKGFTLIEMTTSLAAASVIILAMGGVITDSYSIWDNLYGNVFGTDAQNIVNLQRAFNKTCRKATLRNVFLSSDRKTMRVYYFSNPQDPDYWPDRYATFYLEGSDLKVEHGTLDFATLHRDQTLNTQTLCTDVEYLKFAVQSLSVQISITVNNNGNKKTFSWACVRHN